MKKEDQPVVYQGIPILTLEFDGEIKSFFFVHNEMPFEFESLEAAKGFIDSNFTDGVAIAPNLTQGGDSGSSGG